VGTRKRLAGRLFVFAETECRDTRFTPIAKGKFDEQADYAVD
jgi:hypothetical protein